MGAIGMTQIKAQNFSRGRPMSMILTDKPSMSNPLDQKFMPVVPVTGVLCP